MTPTHLVWVCALVTALVASGVAVAYTQYRSRVLFVELQQLRAERDRADAEWGKLQLELGAQGGLGRVTRIAGERLQMRLPTPDQIVVVR